MAKQKKHQPRRKPAKRKAKKPHHAKAKAPKPQAKRKAKKLVKLKRTLGKTHRPAPRQTGKPKRQRHASADKKNRVKLVRRRLSADEELQVNALIARVYQKAAEEMRQVEDASTEARQNLFAHAAQEVARMEQLAQRFRPV